MLKIEGVVAPHGGGAASRGGRDWSITFTLDPWREVGGDWRRRDPLFVTVPARSKALASRQGFALRGGMILRVDARRIVPAGRYTLQRADGRPPLRRISGDASAQALVKQRDRPHTIRDPLLGALRLERAYGWLSARRRIDGRPYDLSIEVRDADDAASMAADVAKAKPRLLRTERQLPAIRRAVARKLLPTYNDGWRTQRPRSSAPAFLKRIALSSIQLARANHHPLRRRRPVRRPRDRGPDRRARRHLRDPAGGVVSG